MSTIDARERLIVALDLPDVAAARDMIRRLVGEVTFYKIGLTLQLAPGAEELIRSTIEQGYKVFLDYKYYDIAATMKKAVAQAAALGVSFLTVHGSGNVIQGAVQGRGASPLKLFAVTVLTNMDKQDIAELGYSEQTVEELVLFRAGKALEAGCDGVIASGQEAAAIKKLSQEKLLVVVPGIRPDGYPDDDQKRKVTPRDAILAGADYLVIGRPITGAADPRNAAAAVIEEMQAAFETLTSPAYSTTT
jgi:orotidine-5'-phosphate decarboxylase